MQLEVGNIIEGKVCTITKFGAFVELGGGKTGLVHISEITSEYVKDINTYLKLNQIVKVKILMFEKDGRISLSIKKAEKADDMVNSSLGDESKSKTESRFRTETRSKPDSFPRNYANSRNENTIPITINFEDKLAKFMKESNDKLYDLKKKMDPKRKKSSKKKVENHET